MNLNVFINEQPSSALNDVTTFHQSAAHLPPIVQHHAIFRGDQQSPFLAPRGVWITDNKLIVADTGQNRVFIWNQIPEQEYASPDVVLGQTVISDTGRNAGHEVAANTLQYPSGIWSDGQRLIVADAWNHRVLIWHRFPTCRSQPADVVLGQPDFEHNQPNVYGIGSSPSAQSLNWPYGVFSDGTHLWVADTGNRRVLFYETIPTTNFSPANRVIGKPSFTERDYENHEPIWPYSVRVSPQGQLAVADTQYYRNLVWNHWRQAFDQAADVIVGQPSFEANGMNQFGLFPKQNTLSWTYDAFFYKQGIFVADTGNSRLLWFEQVPTHHAKHADNLIGHASFGISSENANTRFGTDKQLYWPFSICVSGNRLAVADTGNHRIILYELFF
ncbi:MAG: NHL repeat-containing protein [Spirosomataceae bacterium]